jgi:hypothetical protein
MDTKRLLLFLVGCIGIRSLFVLIAKTVSPTYLPYLGYAALLPAIGFFAIYAFGLRKTGPEVFGERIWWNDLRPVHGALYGLFALSAIQGKSYSWMFLLVDVVLGLGSFLWQHFGRSIAT